MNELDDSHCTEIDKALCQAIDERNRYVLVFCNALSHLSNVAEKITGKKTSHETA